MRQFEKSVEAASSEGGDSLLWKRVDRPTGFIGWAKLVWIAYWAWAGLCIVVNYLILDFTFDASAIAKVIATLILLPLAILIALSTSSKKIPWASLSRPRSASHRAEAS